MHKMQIMDHTGHTEYEWSQDDIDQRFDELVERFNIAIERGVAFDVTNKAKPRLLKTFDPNADIVITPLYVGG